MKSSALLLLTASISFISLAQEPSNVQINRNIGRFCSFFPANNLRFPVKANSKQITYSNFKKILSATESVYKPIFASLGLGNFNVVDRWTDDNVNACASVGLPCYLLGPSGDRPLPTNQRFVEVDGGLARHPYTTQEGLMLAICHEIGHHLGGYPRNSDNTDEMATEGQSDYFATAKCSRLIYAALSPKTNQNWQWTNQNQIPKEVTQSCTKSFGAGTEANTYCARSSLAGLSLAQVLGSIEGKKPEAFSFSKKDTSVVTETFESHPEAQCRLDTYVAGAVCQADPHIAFSPLEPKKGACFKHEDPGARPTCWFKL